MEETLNSSSDNAQKNSSAAALCWLEETEAVNMIESEAAD